MTFRYTLPILAMMLAGSGCANFSKTATRKPDEPEHRQLQAIDDHMKAEACRRTALELAAHEKDRHAIEQFKRAREISPDMEGIAHPLAVLYDQQGQVDAAEREYRRALKETPRAADLYNDYGYFLYSQGKLADAEQALRKALELQQDHPQAQVNLELVLAASDRYEEAFTQFEAAAGTAAAHHNIGMLLARTGRQERALVHLRKAVQRDPSLEGTRRLLATLEQTAPEESPIRHAGAHHDARQGGATQTADHTEPFIYTGHFAESY
ncbi:photosystem I assembly protein Ycf3 [Maioricimonas rarisocia]|uniref:Photosystem I assembly protein Ycf3 n=1 Tax=Maioricimonas rarisocia TaxID=2528026 RepID=A0A517Z937_9PLAN|nr:tetratricopeptide repeat protein [Maioricimonas rarisocia]QDU39002.1 photosystem I assembly protein Ycf3 [Maioricimonas rarisocia]